MSPPLGRPAIKPNFRPGRKKIQADLADNLRLLADKAYPNLKNKAWKTLALSAYTWRRSMNAKSVLG